MSHRELTTTLKEKTLLSELLNCSNLLKNQDHNLVSLSRCVATIYVWSQFKNLNQEDFLIEVENQIKKLGEKL
jgi:hypothetical protein